MKTLELVDILLNIMTHDPFALTVLILIGILISSIIFLIGWIYIQERILDIQTGIREKTYTKNVMPFFYNIIALHINRKRDKKYFDMFIKEVAVREALYPLDPNL